MHYFYIEGETLSGGEEVALSNRDINHAYRVLRLKAGDEVVVADGLGMARQGTITFSSPQKILVMLGGEQNQAESPLKITLFQSLVKGDKMDLIIRQAVELGVYRIVPFVTGRSIPRYGKQQDEKKLLRWYSKIRSAAAQCRRAFLPTVEPVCTLQSALHRIRDCKALVPWEEEKVLPFSNLLKQPCPQDRAVLVFIGPEGGFEKVEIEALVKAGADKVHLGPRILRSETAAAVVITMVQAAWGDLSGEGECN